MIDMKRSNDQPETADEPAPRRLLRHLIIDARDNVVMFAPTGADGVLLITEYRKEELPKRSNETGASYSYIDGGAYNDMVRFNSAWAWGPLEGIILATLPAETRLLTGRTFEKRDARDLVEDDSLFPMAPRDRRMAWLRSITSAEWQEVPVSATPNPDEEEGDDSDHLTG